ncbi:hybrid sensor histidine kinase/response regulator [Leptolyngbya sp. ST-U4]|uniref:hybrid sensor histidine kinase/response regulator n=1 Tax=Leptolyngbya sp. ST-U4 TaxID=2933912 RepID=UPI0019CB5F95|nr:response regulator [Cyanobacteria bacterium FACHB-502]
MPDYSMLDLFRQEVAAQVASLKQHLMMLKQQPRSAHEIQDGLEALKTIHGLAQVVGVEAVLLVIRAIQTQLTAAQRGIELSLQEIDRLLQAADWLIEVSHLDESDRATWLATHLEDIAILQAANPPINPIEIITDLQDETFLDRPYLEAFQPEEFPAAHSPSELGDLGGIQSLSPPPQFPANPLIDAQMLDLFRLEVEEQAKTLNNGLLTLEAQPMATQPLEALMRAAHSIKGAARIVGLDAAVDLAHTMEDCFVAAQNRTLTLNTDLVDELLRGVDLLQSLSQVSDRDLSAWLTQHDAAIDSVRSIIQTLRESPEHSPPERTAAFTPFSENGASENGASENGEKETAEQAPAAGNGTGKNQKNAAHSLVTGSNVGSNVALNASSNGSAMRSSSPGGIKPSSRDSAPSSTGPQRVVRVSAENLNRIMGLAGESLIEANALPVFADALMQVRSQQIRLAASLEALEQRLLNQVGLSQVEQTMFETVRQQEQRCRNLLSDRLTELEEFIRRTTSLSDRLYHEVITSHMRPFEEGVQNFSRMVRDLARSLNKQARLEIIGKSTSVDRDILGRLEAPITHILRNAIDHGIESPQDRIAAGKPPEGRIRLEAAHRGGMLAITIVDDGAGIDVQRLRRRAVDRHLVMPDVAARLSNAELMEFLFLPGFSLSTEVTEISGRGVGLDIVKSMAQEVGGTVRVSSKPGKGTSFHFQLPLTLSVVRTLLVEVAGEVYAFPLARIDQIVTLKPEEISTVENRQYFTLDDRNIGLISLYQVLDLPPPNATPDPLWVVILSDQSATYGLMVDRCVGERELVVRPLDPRLGKVQDVSAAALMANGSLVLILDVSDLIRSLTGLLNNGRLAKLGETQSSSGEAGKRSRQGEDTKRVLVVDDSITVREMERKLLQNRGYVVDVAVDGMEGWNAIRSYPYDLVISDIDMPRMNGIELIKEIKKHSRFRSIPVIVVSYRDRDDDRIQGLEAGADYYLTKNSFHDDTLIRAVTDLIGE